MADPGRSAGKGGAAQAVAEAGAPKMNMTLQEGGLIESGRVTPVVDTVYPLPETATALEHYGRGHTPGKVIITMLGIER
jgi:NADPH:quinone reductase-like Zn-dependent oxidoreductase